ncbi:helix-turn-helix transcriptional regulator [Streptomyces sp. DSM 44917]|uniref:Helix-turn-helix transcriptional regulator n=1 Tax=Streptomyces boetiae TaxID=3075541 RepID=A0ABU2L3S5_9ACTN|nr:helix-turn-helix transcriptional regulator [Streptomyces sp. DSM 44917]MDT0306215.1 helix-turn-helix transcriptional regulator [Streptomyces sp. DSM 44917]
MSEETPAEHMNDLTHLGVEIREARENRKLTQRHLARAAGYSESYVSKVESGTVLPSEKFVAACDTSFGTNGLFARLRERIVKRGHPTWFQPYARLEREASSILNYSANLVAGILQTGPYARAVIRAAFPREADEFVNERAEARLQRREVMKREKPPLLWVVLHEGALRTRVGEDHHMREQLGHLLKEAKSPHVVIQVLTFDAGAPPSAESFTLLSFAGRSGVVYSDTPMGGQVSDAEEAVTYSRTVFDRLRAAALSPAASLALIRQLMEEYPQ